MTKVPKEAQSRQVVLITGASTGIGLALVHLLKEENYFSIVTSRSESLFRFEEANITESEKMAIRPLDVTRADQADDLFHEIESKWSGVDILVNNAGVSYRAVMEHVSDNDQMEQFAINYFGPMNIIRHALPYMREQRYGRIINVSSVGGMMAMPTMSVYSASKFALEGASEGLWYELRPWNIHVSLVQPGFVNSSGFKNVRMTPRSRRSFDDGTAAYHEHYEHMSDFVARHMRQASATPESVAAKIVSTMKDPRPPLRVPATRDAIFFSLLRRWLPRGIYHRLLYRALPGVKSWGTNSRFRV